MATGILMNYGTSKLMGPLSSLTSGITSSGFGGQGVSMGNLGSSAGSGMMGMGMSSFLGGAGGLSSMMGSSSGGNMMGGMSSLLGQGMMSGGGSTAGASGSATGSSGSLLGSGIGGMGSSGMGMLTQFGQSVFSNSSSIGDAQYNSKMTELRNYNTMQHGVYNRAVSYKEAQLVNQEAEMRLAALRRELYRREHSIGSHKGVRLDSGSIVDVKEELIKQAGYDAEVVKYQASVNSGRNIDRGNMSVWTAHSTSVLNKNVADKAEGQVRDESSKSLMNSGMSAFNSALSTSR